jgi:hypothetical protein
LPDNNNNNNNNNNHFTHDSESDGVNRFDPLWGSGLTRKLPPNK